MKRIFGLLIGLILMFSMTGCKSKGSKTTIELNEDNYWKYITVTGMEVGGVASYVIEGVLMCAVYEDVVFSFDVIYYTDGQAEEDYNSYTMLIACTASGDARFTTYSSGITNVATGKWMGISDGELINLENYKWKMQFHTVSGKVVY